VPEIRLIATDLDNTLLRTDKSLSPRNQAALRAAGEAGVAVVPATARQPLGLLSVVPSFGEWADLLGGWAVCSNGALGVHLPGPATLFEATMPVPAQRSLVTALRARVPGVVFCAVRDGGATFLVEEGYAALATWGDHNRDPRTMQVAGIDGLAGTPNLKMVARHPEFGPEDLWQIWTGLEVPGVGATRSGAPFLEFSAAGIDKAWGLARLCARLGIGPDQVVALGDGHNDLDMLVWAGHGVAMGNAVDEVKAAADEVGPACDEDGFAVTVEAVLG